MYFENNLEENRKMELCQKIFQVLEVKFVTELRSFANG